MDSLKNQKAVNSHHSKVVTETQNVKTSNQGITSSVKGNQSDLKDTNFEYEDNEWDIGIGDLIIDLDADIEKSSSSNLDSSLVIPLQSATGSERASSVDKKENKDSTEASQKNQSKVKSDSETMASTTNSGNKGTSKMSIDHQATLDKGLKMKIKRTKTGNSKHEIVKSEQNGNLNNDDSVPLINSKKQQANILIGVPASPSSSAKRGNNSHRKDKESVCTCGTEKAGNTPCGSNNCVKHRDLSQPRNSNAQSQISLGSEKQSSIVSANTANAPGPPKEAIKVLSQSGGAKQKEQQKMVDFSSKSQSNSSSATSSNYTSSTNSDDGKMTQSPPMKRIKCDSKNMVDVCVGTSIGTITEPDHLGPCEPGTSVTLEGIVWHETEGGVLAVNVTWRGKTYVGTLIDCTKHDWAPPRFCDSPTEELDARLPKGGRGKRGRTATNDLLNFTETRSSVHSKLRNGGPKGRASRNSSMSNLNISAANASNAVTNTPSTSPTTFSAPRPEKRRKSKDESPSPFNGNNIQSSAGSGSSSNSAPSQSSQTGAKKTKSVTSPCAISPVLLECPEQDCSKKYKHANGLKYHQSHAHGIISNADDDSMTAPDSPSQRSQSPPPSNRSNDKISLDSSFSQKLNFEPAKTTGAASEAKINNSHESSAAVADRPNENNVEQNASPFSEAIAKPGITAASTPSKQETQSKPNILRFASSDIEQTSNDSMSDLQSQSSSFYSLQGSNKASNLGKNKKNRKSPGPETDTEISTVNKSDGHRSPAAYSDISDDSNTAVENNLSDKLKGSSDIKKLAESGSSNPLSIGGYNNMYGPFYQPSPFFQPPDNQSTKPLAPQSGPPGSLDYKSKEPSPLDLMNKIQPSKSSQNEPANNSSNPANASNPVGKMMQHFGHYPYNFIQPNYPYNMENSFGSLPPTSGEDSKPPQGLHIKEEIGKELPSPDAMKSGMPSKLIKTEGNKEIKPEPGQSLATNLSHSPQHLSPYSNMYQRHPIGHPPMSREEELQNRYFIYPDQRRPSVGSGTPTNLSAKDERTSQSPTASHANSAQSSSQHVFKSSKSSSSSSSSKSNVNKDIKMEEKEPKVKQEGQKPTMETQGPPPPPTSQYYLPYMGPTGNPFFPDPSHPMYRNMLVPSAPYQSPYHLQAMARFSSPEDLSRNPNTKALDLLQQHANQYYNTHKIHELSERMKSPTNNPKIPVTSVSSPNVSQPLSGTNVTSSSQISTSLSSNTSSINHITQSNLSSSSTASLSSSQQSAPKTNDKMDRVDVKDPLSGNNGSLNRSTSPPPQRHVHTHHHTHVGIGYMSGPIGYSAPYVNPAVLANQQAVINPFTNPPSNK